MSYKFPISLIGLFILVSCSCGTRQNQSKEDIEITDVYYATEGEVIEGNAIIFDDAKADAFDEFLNRYEAHVNAFEALATKAKAKPYDVQSIKDEFNTLLKEGQDFASGFDNIKGNPALTQVARFNTLKQKQIQAAQDVVKAIRSRE